MPAVDTNKSQDGSQAKLSGSLPRMADLAHKATEGLRNIVNQEQLKAWLAELASDKLDGAEPQRRAACEKWLATVGRNWALKKGEATSFSASEAELASEPEWVKKALASGTALHRLLLSGAERERLAGALDWMRSDEGPGIGSDWSKISLPQAEASERAWIEARGRAALKRDLEAAEASGTELLVECGAPGPDGRLGWRWVEVKSPASLDREGALMRHCVGSYAKDVANGKKSVYSLRDPDNQPKLTVEAQSGRLTQLKSFANQSCPRELKGRVADFARAFEELCERREWEIETVDEMMRAGVVSLAGAGLAIAGEPLRDSVAAKVDGWIAQGVGEKVDAVLPILASLGDLPRVLAGLPSADERAKNRALAAAAGAGHVELVKLLLRVADPKADESQALIGAAENGQVEAIKLLLPVSDPMAVGSRALALSALNGHTEAIKLLLPVSAPLDGDSRPLAWAAERGHVGAITILLPVSDPMASNSRALTWAAERGHVEAVKLLLPVSDPMARDSQALREAAQRGHTEVIKILLPVSDSMARGSQALIGAAQRGHTEAVKLLLPVSAPMDRDSQALIGAAERGHTEVVQLLLPVSDPMAKDSLPLRVAAFYGHAAVVKLLLPVSDPLADDSGALRLARKQGHTEIASLIQAHIDPAKALANGSLSKKLASRRAPGAQKSPAAPTPNAPS